jgi:hypothetical protein
VPLRPDDRAASCAKQQDQFAAMLDRIAEIGRIKPEIAKCARRRRLAGLPIRVAGELANLFAAADTSEFPWAARTLIDETGRMPSAGMEVVASLVSRIRE